MISASVNSGFFCTSDGWGFRPPPQNFGPYVALLFIRPIKPTLLLL